MLNSGHITVYMVFNVITVANVGYGHIHSEAVGTCKWLTTVRYERIAYTIRVEIA